MSEENVGLVRRLYEAYFDGQLATVAEAILDSEIEWHASDAFGVVHGREAVVAHLNDFVASFDDWKMTAMDLLDAGDNVIGVHQASGVGRTSGVTVDFRFAGVYSVRANKIVLVREFETRTEALEAVGLEE